MLYGSSSKPQIALSKCNKMKESGNGVILRNRLTALTRRLHDLKLINEEGTPTIRANKAISTISAAHPMGLIPEPRGTPMNGTQHATTKALLPMPAIRAIFPLTGVFPNDLNRDENRLIR